MRSIILFVVCFWPAVAGALTLTGETVWQGKMTLSETVRVEAGATLRVQPGAQIHFTGGELVVAGRLVAREAEFSGTGWLGIVLKGAGADTLLADCTIRDAETGIQVESGAPRLEGLNVTGNRVGIELRQKTDATVSGCRFHGNSRVGLFVKDGATAAVVNNQFEQNGKFGAYIYRSTPRKFAGNVFNDNPTGLMVSHFGSNPELVENCLTGNGIGILIDRAARPQLRRNDIQENEVGVRCYRRSDPLLEGNRISANRTGVSVAYSSYPVLRGNDLSGNKVALFLEFQSADWERQKGEQARSEEVSKSAFGASPQQEVTEADRRPADLAGRVDARDNWWGTAETASLKQLGAEGNPAFIDDGRDRPTFDEGGATWPLDQVLFSPWRTDPVQF